jgi:hypothetical protein
MVFNQYPHPRVEEVAALLAAAVGEVVDVAAVVALRPHAAQRAPGREVTAGS